MKAFNRSLLFSAAVILVCCLFSCKPDKSNNAVSQQDMIVGTWNLQQEHVMLSIDGVKTIDTVYTANAATNTYAYAIFNSDGTDSTKAVYNPGSLSLSGPAPSFQTSKGNYAITNSTFNTAFGVSGWFSYAVGTTGAPTAESMVYKITTLTQANLNLQEQLSFTATNSGTHTYSITSYYYYTK